MVYEINYSNNSRYSDLLFMASLDRVMSEINYSPKILNAARVVVERRTEFRESYSAFQTDKRALYELKFQLKSIKFNLGKFISAAVDH